MRLQAAGFTNSTYTDTEGKWSTDGIVPGVPYTAYVTPSDRQAGQASTQFMAKPGEVLDLGDMTLKQSEDRGGPVPPG